MTDEMKLMEQSRDEWKAAYQEQSRQLCKLETVFCGKTIRELIDDQKRLTRLEAAAWDVVNTLSDTTPHLEALREALGEKR